MYTFENWNQSAVKMLQGQDQNNSQTNYHIRSLYTWD